MRLKNFRTCNFLLVLQMLVVCALATPGFADGGSDFDRGIAFFKKGDYEQAVSMFESALASGQNSAKVRYNLASSYYKLALYESAKQHFNELLQHKRYGALANYNLGLIGVREGQLKKALNHFRKTRKQSSNPRIQALCDKLISKINKESKAAKHKSKKSSYSPFRGLLGASIRYDDNVGRVNDDIEADLKQSDRYYETFAFVTFDLKRVRALRNQLKLGVRHSQYRDLNAYDQIVYDVGLYQRRTHETWKVRYGVHYFHDRLDGEGFQQRYRFQIRNDYYFQANNRLRLQYEYTFIDELNEVYQSSSGHRHRVKIEYMRQWRPAWRVKLGYRAELNDRDDFDTQNTFLSRSPQRHTFSLSVKYAFSRTYSIQMDIERRQSYYPDEDVQNGTVLGEREDQRNRFAVRTVYDLSKNIYVELKARLTDNDSNFDDKEYSNKELSFSVNYLF